jgi:chromosome segregation ATPase
VADDEETAKKVAFNNDYGKFNCVTLKGDKYSPSGTLEGGFKKESGILLNV